MQIIGSIVFLRLLCPKITNWKTSSIVTRKEGKSTFSVWPRKGVVNGQYQNTFVDRKQLKTVSWPLSCLLHVILYEYSWGHKLSMANSQVVHVLFFFFFFLFFFGKGFYSLSSEVHVKEQHELRISYMATQSAKVLLSFSCNCPPPKGKLGSWVYDMLKEKYSGAYLSLCENLTEASVSNG